MNYFRKLKIKRLRKEGFSLNELLLMYPEHNWQEIVEAIRNKAKA